MKKKDLEALWTRLGSEAEGENGDIPDEKIAEALQSDAHGVFQTIYDKGHSNATERSTSRTKELETELATAKGNLTKAQEQLEEYRKKAPDSEKLREQYERDLEKIQQEHEEKVKTIESKLVNEREKRHFSELKAHLVDGKQRLDPDYADVLTQKEEVRKRIKFTEDGELEVLQAGKEIALAPADGVSPLALLAEELKKNAPKKFILVEGDRGAGAGGEAGSGGGFFGNYRERLEEERKGEDKRQPSAAERMKIGTPAQ